MMDNTLNRLTRIAVRYAKRFGVVAAVYANGTSFDVLCERAGLIAWLRLATGDAYRNPRAVALGIRRDLRKVWAA